jgi:flagellar hook-associated protein 1 FlgK
LTLTPQVLGGQGMGVQVRGITRVVDIVAIGDRRYADAALAGRQARSDFLSRVEGAVGVPGDPYSLTGRIASFEAALIQAAAAPDAEARLSQVAESARALAGKLAQASDEVQASRERADDLIETQIATVNTALERIAELNGEIRVNTGMGRDASALMDQRQQVIDSISSIVPLREYQREGGVVALYTATGAVLVDGTPSVLGFTPAGVIASEMTLGSGALSGLTLNGRAITTSGENSGIAGGSLAANFALRDELAVKQQAKLDAIARDLVERFQDPAVDPTLASGDAGLFTDLGAAFDSANEIGLSQRLRLNAAADPQQGGALWRLRDGLGAATPGAVGDPTLLNALHTALTAPREPVSGGFMAGERSFAGLAGEYVSVLATARLTAEGDTAFAQSKAETLKQIELATGVDTDAEMQKLLLIEQAYAANAKVMQTIEAMIQIVMEI